MIRRLTLLVFPVLFCILTITGCTSHPMLEKQYALCAYVPANEQFDSNASVTGKIAVVYKGSNYRTGYYSDCDLDGYSKGFQVETFYFPAEIYAQSPEELETLIMIELKKGKFLKSAVVKQSVSRSGPVDVYSGKVVISMINYKTSTLLRNSVRENTTVPTEVRSDRLKLLQSPGQSDYEYVVEPSIADLRTYLSEFSDSVKNQ